MSRYGIIVIINHIMPPLGPAAGVLTAVASSGTLWFINGNSMLYCLAAISVAILIGLTMTKEKRQDKLYVVSSALLSGLVSTSLRA